MDNDHKFFTLRATKLALITRKSKVTSQKFATDVHELGTMSALEDQIVWLDGMIDATNLMIEESLKSEIPF